MAIDSPLKLDTTYNPVLLYNFDGKLGDDGSLGYDLNVARGTLAYGEGHEFGTKGVFFKNSSLGLEGSAPAPAAARIIGDMTLQVVLRFSEFGVGSFGSQVFGISGPSSNAEADNHCFIFTLRDSGGERQSPEFQWEYGASGTRVRVFNDSFSFFPGQWYHVVMRRSDAGSGNQLGEIIVNRRSVAFGTDVAASGGGNCFGLIGNNGSAVDLPKCVISSIKVNDRALTDDEIEAEFQRIKEKL